MLNPITFTEKIVSDFLRYQLATYPFSDSNLLSQMRQLLSMELTRQTPLLKGPYVSLSRSFRKGKQVAELVAEGLLHPLMTSLAPYPNVYGHQEQAIESIVRQRQTTLVSTGTGSGKTECFLYPIISRCLQLRDERAAPGIVAVLVYPMNALAEDQLGRLRELLAGTGVSFGMYVGKTPQRVSDVAGVRLPSGASRADYRAAQERLRKQKQPHAVHPFEERPSREEMRLPGQQPRILLTNVKQLELLLTRHQDVELFDGARLEYLVFDEAHTFTGAIGAETACLVRRLRSFCGRQPGETVCVATSATLVDPKRSSLNGQDFAARLFGVAAADVAVVGEQFEDDRWANKRVATIAPPGDPAVHLKNILEVVSGVEKEPPEPVALQLLRTVFQAMTGQPIEQRRELESLYEQLAQNDVVYQLARLLNQPRPLDELVAELGLQLHRSVSEEEVLAWLALGAASRKDGRPLLRPVVHGFVRGVSGAVVTFPTPSPGAPECPRLWLSAEDATQNHAQQKHQDGLFRLNVTTCTTCGQHYFLHHVQDFQFTEKRPSGGQAVGVGSVWRKLDPTLGGKRLVLLDRLVVDDEPDEEDASAGIPRNTAPVFLCRYCGALHPGPAPGAPTSYTAPPRCLDCQRPGSLALLYVVRQRDSDPGYLTSCVSCSALGRRRLGDFREPARPVRAVTVSDVHVLAQSMIQHAERRRLLVFADNRQDAAFQAGWMQDHARRYRLRALMHERIVKGPVSIGDLTAWLDDLLDHDDDLSRALIPEVWRAERKESAGNQHAEERKFYLRIQVLREVATGGRQRIGLEPWGRLLVEYQGLNAPHRFYSTWAGRIGCKEEELVSGIAGLLDAARRGNLLLDRESKIYSTYFREGDRPIAKGYLPMFQGGPKGLKLRRDSGDNSARVRQWLSDRGDTAARQAARKWGILPAQMDEFFSELWAMLTEDLKLLGPVSLVRYGGRVLPGCAGVYQVDGDRLRLLSHKGVFRCDTCRRAYVRTLPKNSCLAWRCQGHLVDEPESAEDYDLMMLDSNFAMIRPREHSAQIPPEDREVLERAFKGENELCNALVCTPTLELGVDIGGLDTVLMRNVPPLPQNYWQRAGRAGRRHRMAVNLTYARGASHDRAYFASPLKMLQGVILPPRFNLRNEPMVRKHVHATVLSVLHQLARTGSPLSEADRKEVVEGLLHGFPNQVKSYLFDDSGDVRVVPFDVTPLTAAAHKHASRLLTAVQQVFSQGWPEEASLVVQPDLLRGYISDIGTQLAEVIARLSRRLRWALEQMERLDTIRTRKGTLDPDEDALRTRCDRLIKRLKGLRSRHRREAEGYDDTNTYGVLAAEGFLPGYGLDTGSVIGSYQAPRYSTDIRDWELRRSTALALREYVPGNLIYANGHRFLPRFFEFEELVEPVLFRVDIGHEEVSEIGTTGLTGSAGLGTAALHAIPVCNVQLPHFSHISDEEDYRFQLGVSVYGYDQGRHSGGQVYAWGQRELMALRSVAFRLVNVGASSLVRDGGRLGYPVCLVCGQSRSPMASQADRDEFAKQHHERCGRQLAPVGFFADVTADALCLIRCASREEAYSVMESLRKGAAQVLEMEQEDLQLLAVPRDGELHMFLYDPMPGGSGLLDQMITRFDEVVAAAQELVSGCPGVCKTACIDCLLHFRNAYYHRHLNRHTALGILRQLGGRLALQNDIPAQLPTVSSGTKPSNDAESTLRTLLLRAGFPDGKWHHGIDLGKPLGTTEPDVYYSDPIGRSDGVCIYLDGMSTGLHGNAATKKRDHEIREELRSRGFEVFVIPFGHLTDRAAMTVHFYRLGRILLDKERALIVRDQPTWFDDAAHAAVSPPNTALPARPKTTMERSSGWDEILDMLDESWQPLGRGLAKQGLRPPDDVDWDLMNKGRVSDRRAVMVWHLTNDFVAVVMAGDEVMAPTRCIPATTDSDAEAIAARLRPLLEG